MTIDQNSLDVGEKLIWRGGPDAKAYWERYTFFGFRPGLALLGIAILCAAYEYFSQGNASSETQLLVTALFVVAAILLYVPLRVWRIARNTEYAVTDRRAIIEVPGILLRNRVSVLLSEVRRIEVQNQSPGDLLFRDVVSQSEHGGSFIRDGFFTIPDAFKVEGVLRSAVEKARSRDQPQ